MDLNVTDYCTKDEQGHWVLDVAKFNEAIQALKADAVKWPVAEYRVDGTIEGGTHVGERFED